MIQNIGKYYLYRHIRLDLGSPFYIGIGTKPKNSTNSEYCRSTTHNNRSTYWKNIVAKTEYEVEILLESDDYDFIKQKEIEFIGLYKRIDCCGGILVNMTDGGDGSVGNIPSEETKMKRSVAQLGVKNHMYGKKGEDNPSYGKSKHSEEQKSIWSDSRKGTQTGENNPFYGKAHSEEQIKKWKVDERRIHKGKENGMFEKSGELAPRYGRIGELHPMFGKEGYWKGRTLPKEAVENMLNKGGKIVLDIETGVYYMSIREDADYCRLTYGYLQQVFKGKYKNHTSLRLV